MVDAVWQLDAPRVCDLLDGISFASVAGELEPRYANGTPFPESIAVVAMWARIDAARAERLAVRLRELGADPDTV